MGHHGEILQGVAEAAHGRLRRVMVSLVCHIFRSRAVFTPAIHQPLTIRPVWKIKAFRAAQLTIKRCGIRHLGGLLTIETNIPLRWGLGSSTADVTATIRAVASACNRALSAEEVAELSVASERASDSVMFETCAVVFAHREGVIVERLPGHLPPLDILGFNTDPAGAGIETLTFRPAHYTWREIEAFRHLLDLLRRAVYLQDSSLLGRVASASARINQRFLAKPHFDQLQRLAETVGAAGLQVAHSGTVAGLLFQPQTPELDARIRSAKALLGELGFANCWRFRTPGQ